MDLFHGIVIEESLEDNEILEKTKILSKKKTKYSLHKISFPRDKIDDMIRLAQLCLKKGKWYMHFYSENDLIIVYKKVVFLVSAYETATWNPAIEHGRSIGIPEKEIDFRPCRIEEEEW